MSTIYDVDRDKKAGFGGGLMHESTGLESLSKQKLKKQRSASQEAKTREDAFDSDSEVFSAFRQDESESSLHFDSRNNSPEHSQMTKEELIEGDVDAIDASLISLTN